MHQSKLEYDEYVEINDIIIHPNGKIFDDWNEYGSELDIEKYTYAVNNISI